jgi:hypothetical protein
MLPINTHSTADKGATMKAYAHYLRSKPLRAGLIAVALSALIGAAGAQQSPVMSGGSTNLVMSGGVGLEERAQFAQHEREANLKLVFTEPQGSYLSDIGVKVFDRNGQMVLDTTTNGPWLLAKLPAGSYRVVAMDQGAKQEVRVSVGQGLRTVHIRMPEQGGLPGRPTMS